MANKDVEINIKIKSENEKKLEDINKSFKEIEKQQGFLSKAFSHSTAGINSISGAVNSGVKNIKSYSNEVSSLYKKINTGINILGHFNPALNLTGEVMKEVGKTISIATIPLRGYLNTTEKISGIIEKVSGHFIKNKEAVEEDSQAISELGNNFNSANENISNTSSLVAKLTAYLATMFTASQALESSSEFNYNMRQINSIAQLQEESFLKTRDSVMELADSLKLANSISLSGGMADLVSSNFSIDESIQILEKSTKAAKANFTDAKTMTEAASTVLLSFNKNVSQTDDVLNILTKTLQVGKGTMEELNSAIGTGISLSATVNQKFEESAAVLAVLSTRGETNATAATKHTQILQSAVKPTTESIKAQEKLAKQLGYTGMIWDTNTIKSLGFSKALEQLIEKTKGHDLELAQILGTTEALVGVQKLSVDSLEAYKSALNETSNANGTYEESLIQYKKTWQSTLEEFNVSITNLKITFGTALEEAFTPFLKAVTWGIDNFNKLDSATKNNIARLIVWSSVIIGVLGTFKLFVFQMNILKISTLAWNFALASTGLTAGGLGITLKGLLATISPFLAVAGIFWGIDLAVKSWKDSSSGVLNFLSEILDKINAIKLARIAFDTWQMNKDIDNNKNEEKEKFEKANKIVAELRKKENKTAEELNKLADALIVKASNIQNQEAKRFTYREATKFRSQAKALGKKDTPDSSPLDIEAIEKDREAGERILDEFNKATMDKFIYQEQKLRNETKETISTRIIEMKKAGRTENEIKKEISMLEITLLNKVSEIHRQRDKEISDNNKKKIEERKKELENFKRDKNEKIKTSKEASEFIKNIEFQNDYLISNQKQKARLDLKKDLEGLYKNYEKLKDEMSTLVDSSGKKVFSPNQVKNLSKQFSIAFKEFEANKRAEIDKIGFADKTFEDIDKLRDKLNEELDNDKLTTLEKLDIQKKYYSDIKLLAEKSLSDKSKMTSEDFEKLQKIIDETKNLEKKNDKERIKEAEKSKENIQEILRDTAKSFSNLIGSALDNLLPGIGKVFDLIMDKNETLQEDLMKTISLFFGITSPETTKTISSGISSASSGTSPAPSPKISPGTFGMSSEMLKEVYGETKNLEKANNDLADSEKEVELTSGEKAKNMQMNMAGIGIAVEQTAKGFASLGDFIKKALSGNLKTVEDFKDANLQLAKDVGGPVYGLIFDLIDIPRQAEKSKRETELIIKRLKANISGDKTELFETSLAEISNKNISPEEKTLEITDLLKKRLKDIASDFANIRKSDANMMIDRRKQIEENKAIALSEAVLIDDKIQRRQREKEIEYEYQKDMVSYNSEIKNLEIELTNDRIAQNEIWYEAQKDNIYRTIGDEKKRNLELQKLDDQYYQKKKDYEIELAKVKADNDSFNDDKATQAIKKAKIEIDEISSKREDSELKKEKILNRQLKLEEELRKIREDYFSDIGNVMSKYYDKELRAIKILHDADYKFIRQKEAGIKLNEKRIDELNKRLQEINDEFDKKLTDKNLAKTASNLFQTERNQILTGNNGVDLAKILNTSPTEFDRYIRSKKEEIDYQFAVDQDAGKKAKEMKKLALQQNIFYGELSKGITKNTEEYDNYLKKANDGFRDYKSAVRDSIEATKLNIIESENLIDKIGTLTKENNVAKYQIDEANSKINTDIDSLTGKFKDATGEWISDINLARMALQGISSDSKQAILDLEKIQTAKNVAESKNISTSSGVSSSSPAPASAWAGMKTGETQDEYIARLKREDAVANQQRLNKVNLPGISGGAVGSGLNTMLNQIKGYDKGGIASGPKSGYLAMLHGTEGIISEENLKRMANIMYWAKKDGTVNQSNSNQNNQIYIDASNMSKSEVKGILKEILDENRQNQNNSWEGS